ncbi:hypothetical protein H6F67_17780 [Microcoleus sp. FACHB-1515]|uniref:hypothetical protein n=1 Tax=Cyanophyceae TaxID=3028117 RepID=UPI00168A3DDC|nr:hypothetical protein [Microcoleus sp. FACHB-1515]MBD2091697.1 hypothetical protein [Microcoleus sp. FACHB-1515]
MTAHLHLPSASIEQIVTQILATRRITRRVQQHFMQTALSQGQLSQAERVLIDRVFEALRSGLVKVVD